MSAARLRNPENAPIRLIGAAFGYDRRRVLEDVDGEIAAGEALAVIGRNGAGKSTLLKGIVGDAERLAGRVELECGARDVAYLPQRLEIDRTFPITVAEFAAMGLWRRVGSWRRPSPVDANAVDDALAKVGLATVRGRLIGALSGGQMQRLLFARTLLQDAPVILLDEPFTSVDARTTLELMGVVTGWRREGRTVVAALHDLGQVADHFPRSLLLDGRPVAWGATREVLAVVDRDRAGHAHALCAHEHAPPEPAIVPGAS